MRPLMSTLERGFKSWAERLASGIRRDLGLTDYAPLSMARLAEYLDVTLWKPQDIPDLPAEALAQLLEGDPSGWSAVTLIASARTIVIYNPRHSAGRRVSDIAHELAHELLEHKPSTVILSPDGGLVMRTFDARQEDEASWLSGCLLLPRAALVHATRGGLSSEAIAGEHGVSVVLTNYRKRITGVEVQTRRARSTRSTTSPTRD